MRWLNIAKKDGSHDPYCIGLVSYTITHGPQQTERYVAWRITAEPPATMLGGYPTEAEAKLACQEDFSLER